MEQLLRTQYANAEKIILVYDNLNTHTRGAFYETFPTEKAREIAQRIEFHYGSELKKQIKNKKVSFSNSVSRKHLSAYP